MSKGVTMRVRHDAPLKVTLKVKGTGEVLDVSTVPANQLDAHLTVQAYCRGGAFNQHNWHNNKGEPIAGITAEYELHDLSYALTEGQECDCLECAVEAADG